MDGWMDGQMDRWMDELISQETNFSGMQSGNMTE